MRGKPIRCHVRQRERGKVVGLDMIPSIEKLDAMRPAASRDGLDRTPEEDAFILRWYPVKNKADLARGIGCSYDTLKKRYYQLVEEQQKKEDCRGCASCDCKATE